VSERNQLFTTSDRTRVNSLCFATNICSETSLKENKLSNKPISIYPPDCILFQSFMLEEYKVCSLCYGSLLPMSDTNFRQIVSASLSYQLTLSSALCMFLTQRLHMFKNAGFETEFCKPR
jgi:hypothetical protein